MKRLILASGSPRRKELLESLGYEFEIITSNVDEVIREGLTNEAIVKDLAYQKAKAVYDENPDALVMGADTIVVCDEEIMGKPHSREQCVEMMKKLRKREHKVITGVAFIQKDELHMMSDTAFVHFRDIPDEDIEKYADTDEAYDKAGGYAIQGWAGRYISRIEGNFYTIMGLPLDKVYAYLRKQEHKK